MSWLLRPPCSRVYPRPVLEDESRVSRRNIHHHFAHRPACSTILSPTQGGLMTESIFVRHGSWRGVTPKKHPNLGHPRSNLGRKNPWRTMTVERVCIDLQGPHTLYSPRPILLDIRHQINFTHCKGQVI